MLICSRPEEGDETLVYECLGHGICRGLISNMDCFSALQSISHGSNSDNLALTILRNDTSFTGTIIMVILRIPLTCIRSYEALDVTHFQR